MKKTYTSNKLLSNSLQGAKWESPILWENNSLSIFISWSNHGSSRSQPKYSLLLWHADVIIHLEMFIASVTHLTGDMGDYLLMFDSSWNSSITMHEKLI